MWVTSITYSCGHVVSVSRLDAKMGKFPERCPVCDAPLAPSEAAVYAEVEKEEKEGEFTWGSETKKRKRGEVK